MAVGPPVIRTVLTSNPSAAKNPKSCATTSGRVPLKVGVLEAKLTVLAEAAVWHTQKANKKEPGRVEIVLICFYISAGVEPCAIVSGLSSRTYVRDLVS